MALGRWQLRSERLRRFELAVQSESARRRSEDSAARLRALNQFGREEMLAKKKSYMDDVWATGLKQRPKSIADTFAEAFPPESMDRVAAQRNEAIVAGLRSPLDPTGTPSFLTPAAQRIGSAAAAAPLTPLVPETGVEPFDRNVRPFISPLGLYGAAAAPGLVLGGTTGAVVGSGLGQLAEQQGAPTNIAGTGIGTRSALELIGGVGAGGLETATGRAALRASGRGAVDVAERGAANVPDAVRGLRDAPELGGTRINSGIGRGQLGRGSYWSDGREVAEGYARGETLLDAPRPRTGNEQVIEAVIPKGARLYNADDSMVPSDVWQALNRNPQFRQSWADNFATAEREGRRTGRNVWDAAEMARVDIQGELSALGYKGARRRTYGGAEGPFDYSVWDDSVLRDGGAGVRIYRGQNNVSNAPPLTDTPLTQSAHDLGQPRLPSPTEPQTMSVSGEPIEPGSVRMAGEGSDVSNAPPPPEPPATALDPGESLRQKFGSYLAGTRKLRPGVEAERSTLLKERVAESARIRDELIAEGVPYDEAVARSKAALSGPMDIEGARALPEIEMTPAESAWLVQRRLELPPLQQIKFVDTLAQIARADPSHPLAPWQWRLIESAWGKEVAESMRLGHADALEDAARSAMASPDLPVASPRGAPLLRGAEEALPTGRNVAATGQPTLREASDFGPQSDMFGVPDSTTFRPAPTNKPPSRDVAEEGLAARARKNAEKKRKDAEALAERQRGSFQKQWEQGERRTQREADQAAATRERNEASAKSAQTRSFQKEWEKTRKAAEREYEKGLRNAGNLPPKGHGVGKFVEAAIKVPATLLSTLDMSAHLLQLWKMTPMNPGAAWKAFKTDVNIWRNTAKAEEKLTEMMADETPILVRSADGDFTKSWGEVADKAGLYLDETNELEDFYLTTVLEKIPGIGRLFKKSRLGFTMSGNVARHDVGLKLVQRMMKYNQKKTGTAFITPEELQQISEFSLRLTGRGDPRFLGQWLSTTLRHLAFAPGFRLSGPQMAMRLASPNPVVRRAAAENLVGWFGLNTAVLGAAYYAGQEVNVDPLSPDFGSIVIGDTGYNLWGTDAVLARAIARSIMSQGHSRTVTLPDGTKQKIEWDTDLMNELTRYVRSGATPVVGDIINLAEGENVVGDKINLNTKEGLGNFLEGHLPLGGQSAADVFKNEQYLQAILSVPFSVVGGKMSSYETNSPNRIVSAMPRYQGVSMEMQGELYDFLGEVDERYQTAHDNNKDISEADVAIRLGEVSGRASLGKAAAALIQKKLPYNAERIKYAAQNADSLDAITLRKAIPKSVAESLHDKGLLTDEQWDKYNSVKTRFTYYED